MADTDVTFQGLYHAVGQTVSVSVAGLDCGDYVVAANGTVTVPINSDPGGNFNGAYLQQFDVGPFDTTTYGDATTRLDVSLLNGGIATIFVPVVIGFTYPSYGVMLRAVGEDQTKTKQGPSLGETRRTHWISILFQDAQGVSLGTSNGTWYPTNFTDTTGVNKLPMNALYSGVWSRPLDDGYSFDSQLGWSVTRPYACSVVAVAGFIETSER